MFLRSTLGRSDLLLGESLAFSAHYGFAPPFLASSRQAIHQIARLSSAEGQLTVKLLKTVEGTCRRCGRSIYKPQSCGKLFWRVRPLFKVRGGRVAAIPESAARREMGHRWVRVWSAVLHPFGVAQRCQTFLGFSLQGKLLPNRPDRVTICEKITPHS